MAKTTRYPSGIIAVEQEWKDLEELNEILMEHPPLGDTASWLMDAYYSTLRADSHTTFGPIESGYLDPSGITAGFTFRDTDSNDNFTVLVSHETNSYRPAPPLTEIHDKAERLLQQQNEINGLTWMELRDFVRSLTFTLKPYIKHREDKE